MNSKQTVSNAVFREHRFDLLVACEFACIGFLDAFVDVANLLGFILHIVGQRIDGQKTLGPCSRLGQLFDLVVKRLGKAYVDDSGGHGVTLRCVCNTTHYPLHKPKGPGRRRIATQIHLAVNKASKTDEQYVQQLERPEVANRALKVCQIKIGADTNMRRHRRRGCCNRRGSHSSPNRWNTGCDRLTLPA